MSDISILAQLDVVKDNPAIFAKWTGAAAFDTLVQAYPYTNRDIYQLNDDETYLFGGRIMLFFGSQGFLYAGRIIVSPLMPMALKIVDSVNCRQWSTTNGAGEMAVKRMAASSTQLDPTPSVWMFSSSGLHFMDCEQRNWAPAQTHVEVS